MPYKLILFFIFTLFSITDCFPQNNPEKKGRIGDNVTEKYHVLPGNEDVKDGPYQALYRRKHVLAEGNYNKGKRTGIWYFYNQRGAMLETYNFDKDSLEFEAFENTRSALRYLVDQPLTDSDKTTKPVKIGGRYYGYLPYLTAFKAPFETDAWISPTFQAQVELLISPLGRLAEYKVHLVSYDYDQYFRLSLNFFKEEDKQFIPAKVNGEPVICRILIRCRLTDNGGLDFN